jgi:uncharacterized membrane protein YhaH (DUF805 family)
VYKKVEDDMNLFSTQGRVGRLSYFLRVLVIYLVTLLLAGGAMVVLLNVVPHHTSNQLAPVVAMGVVLLGSLVILLQGIKRLHDLNRPGIHFLLLLIPIYGLYIGLLLLFQKGTTGANDFGEDPLAAQAA